MVGCEFIPTYHFADLGNMVCLSYETCNRMYNALCTCGGVACATSIHYRCGRNLLEMGGFCYAPTYIFISFFVNRETAFDSGASHNKKHRLNQLRVFDWGTNVKGWKTEPRLPPHLISATASQEVSQLSTRRIARLHQTSVHIILPKLRFSGVTRHTNTNI